jgi:hypothetical protein
MLVCRGGQGRGKPRFPTDQTRESKAFLEAAVMKYSNVYFDTHTTS